MELVPPAAPAEMLEPPADPLPAPAPLEEDDGTASSAAPVRVVTCPTPPTVLSTTPRSTVAKVPGACFGPPPF